MKESAIESGSASLLYQIVVIIANSHRLFFDLFLRHPKGKKYPEMESTRLFEELLSLGCFVTEVLAKRKFGATEGEKVAESMIDSRTLLEYQTNVEEIFEGYKTVFSHVDSLESLATTADAATARIIEIHHGFRRRREHIYSFLMAFAQKIDTLIDESFIESD